MIGNAIGALVITLVAIGVPLVLANLGFRYRSAAILAYVWTWLLAAGTVFAGLAILGFLLLVQSPTPALQGALQGTRLQGPTGAVELAVTALIVLVPALLLALSFRGFRRLLRRFLPIDDDSPVTTVALMMSVIAMAGLLFLDLLFAVLPPQATQYLFSRVDQDRLQVILGELPLFVIGFLGVGVFVRRDFRQSLDRLGIVRPTWWQVSLGIAVAGFLLLLSNGFGLLMQQLMPDSARELEQSSRALLAHLHDPLSAIILGLAAGIAEETLFRGAMQPRFGFGLTAIVFGLFHVQYGLTVTLAAIVVIAVGLGLVRKYANTTTSIITHASYDFLVAFGSGFVALAAVFSLAVPAAMVLVFGGACAFVLLRRRRAESPRHDRMPVPEPHS